MHVYSTLIPALGLFAHLGTAAYTLKDDYGTTDSFFDKFDFFTEPDPTNGFVNYVDKSTAKSSGLIGTKGGNVYIGVDHQNKATTSGRQSVRLSSTHTYNHGLVILDLAHMPGSICGTWPAFWMLGPDWPNNGEIDIIEGANEQSSNQITLHTNSGYSINKSGFSGKLRTSNCDVEAPDQGANVGCSIDNNDDKSYGNGFNQNNGGVYATEWNSEGISVWFFPRSKIPSDVHGNSPNPKKWGAPTARFASSANIDSFVKNQQLVFDVTFCGDWAGKSWSDSSCASKANTCDDFVSNNPSAFAESYWGIKSLKVFQNGGGAQASIGVNVPGVSAGASLSLGGGINSPQTSFQSLPSSAPQQSDQYGGGPNIPASSSPAQASSPPDPNSVAQPASTPQQQQNDASGGGQYTPVPSSPAQASEQPDPDSVTQPASTPQQNEQYNGGQYTPVPSSPAQASGQPDPNNVPQPTSTPQQQQYDASGDGQYTSAPSSPAQASSPPNAYDVPQPTSTPQQNGASGGGQYTPAPSSPAQASEPSDPNVPQPTSTAQQNGAYDGGQYANTLQPASSVQPSSVSPIYTPPPSSVPVVNAPLPSSTSQPTNQYQGNNGESNTGQDATQQDDGYYHPPEGASQATANPQWKRRRESYRLNR